KNGYRNPLTVGLIFSHSGKNRDRVTSCLIFVPEEERKLALFLVTWKRWGEGYAASPLFFYLEKIGDENRLAAGPFFTLGEEKAEKCLGSKSRFFLLGEGWRQVGWQQIQFFPLKKK
ncbi:hypothetical protein IscW_ISCW024166, partial [Ixodes scapularis]